MGTRGARGGDALKAYRLRVDGEEIEVTVEEAAGAFRVRAAGATHDVELVEVVRGWYSLLVGGRGYDLGVRGRAGRWTLTLEGETYTAEVGGASQAGHGMRGRQTSGHRTDDVRAPMPGLLVDVRAAEGETVELGAPLIIMEAMKMQMEIRAPRTGKIRRVHVASGQEVAEGQVLVTLD